MKTYADRGINWIFVYEVLYEDEEILILRDLGRFHKYDEDRTWKKPIDGWLEITGEYACSPNGKLKLVEVQ